MTTPGTGGRAPAAAAHAEPRGTRARAGIAFALSPGACSRRSLPPRVGIEAAPIDVEVDFATGCPAATSSACPTRACARGACASAARSQQRLQAAAAPDHRQPGAGRPAQGRHRVRPADRGRHAVRGGMVARTRSRTRCSWASWRSTARCGRCAACCRSRLGAGARGPAHRRPPGNAAEAAVVGGVRRARAAHLGEVVALLHRRADSALPAATRRGTARAAVERRPRSGRRARPGGRPARARDRRRRRPQPADGRPAGLRARRCSRGGCPASCRRCRSTRRSRRPMVYSVAGLLGGRRWSRAAVPRAAPHGAARGPRGRRRGAAAPGRDHARAQRRAVPRRAARVPARRARGAAPAARGSRRHASCARAAASPSRPTSCWWRRSTPARAATWAARCAPAPARGAAIAALPRAAVGPAARPHRPARRRARRCPTASWRGAAPGEPSAAVRERVVAARERQQRARPQAANARLSRRELGRVARARRRRATRCSSARSRAWACRRARSPASCASARTIADLDGSRRVARPPRGRGARSTAFSTDRSITTEPNRKGETHVHDQGEDEGRGQRDRGHREAVRQGRDHVARRRRRSPRSAIIPTGSVALDVALGVGGLPRGRIVEIYGPESSGKTTLTLHAIAEAQRAGGVCAFIDAEHALDVDYARSSASTSRTCWSRSPTAASRRSRSPRCSCAPAPSI